MQSNGISQLDSVVNHLVALLPRQGNILHIGCGDGTLAERLGAILPSVRFRGVDSAEQKNAILPVHKFNGVKLPFGDASFDAVIMVNMFRGRGEDFILLNEAKRVVREHLVLKDRTYPGPSRSRRMFNWRGQTGLSARVDRPLSRSSLKIEFEKLGLEVEHWNEHSARNLGRPASWVFGSVSEYIVRLRV